MERLPHLLRDWHQDAGRQAAFCNVRARELQELLAADGPAAQLPPPNVQAALRAKEQLQALAPVIPI